MPPLGLSIRTGLHFSAGIRRYHSRVTLASAPVQPSASVRPGIVLIPGRGVEMSTFDDVAALLPDELIIPWPRNGMDGRSTRRMGEVPGAIQDARHLHDLLETAGPGGSRVEQALLVGHSMSGPVIEAFGRLFPERTAGLVFLDASIPRSSGQPKGLSRAKVRAAVRDAWKRSHITRFLSSWSRHPERLLNVDIDNAALEWMIEEATLLRPTHPLNDVPVAVVVATLGLPFQGIWVGRQRAFRDMLRASGAPRAALHVVRPATHLVQKDAPGRIVSIIRSVVRQASGAEHAATPSQ